MPLAKPQKFAQILRVEDKDGGMRLDGRRTPP